MSQILHVKSGKCLSNIGTDIKTFGLQDCNKNDNQTFIINNKLIPTQQFGQIELNKSYGNDICVVQYGVKKNPEYVSVDLCANAYNPEYKKNENIEINRIFVHEDDINNYNGNGWFRIASLQHKDRLLKPYTEGNDIYLRTPKTEITNKNLDNEDQWILKQNYDVCKSVGINDMAKCNKHEVCINNPFANGSFCLFNYKDGYCNDNKQINNPDCLKWKKDNNINNNNDDNNNNNNNNNNDNNKNNDEGDLTKKITYIGLLGSCISIIYCIIYCIFCCIIIYVVYYVFKNKNNININN